MRGYGVGSRHDRAVSPVAAAIACSVSVELTVIGPVYGVEDVVGVFR